MLILPIGDDGSISRSQMPQVDQSDLPRLLVHLGKNGVAIEAGEMDPRLMKAHQAVDSDRVAALAPEKLSSPVLICNGWYVLDGDHRWARHLRDGTPCPYIKIGLYFSEAIDLIKSFPLTYECAS